TAATTAEGVAALCDDNLAVGRGLLGAIARIDLHDAERLSWAATFGRFDDALLAIADASEFPLLLGVVHPDERVRAAAESCEKKTAAVQTALYLDAAVARVLRAYAARGEEPGEERRRFVRRVLDDFRRGGVDLPRVEQERL